MFIEELGVLFKGDPTFNYVFNRLPRSYFMKIVELRRKRQSTGEAQIEELLQ